MNTSDIGGGGGGGGESGERLIFRASPSVSKTQWANFALRKLAEGYVLLQSPNGKAFNFYKAGAPLQPCATHAARRLVESGYIQVLRTDVRGTHYGLNAPLASTAPLIADPEDRLDEPDEVEADLLPEAEAGADLLGTDADLLEEEDLDVEDAEATLDADADDDEDGGGAYATSEEDDEDR